MPFLNETLGKEEDLGEWHIYDSKAALVQTSEPAKEGATRLRIRAVPDSELRRIRRRHFGNQQELRHQGREAYSSWETEKGQLAAIDKAVYALTAAEGLDVKVDPDNAQTYTKLLGQPVKGDEVLLLDQHLTAQVKEHVLGQFDQLVQDINAASDALKAIGAKKEERLKS